jgi:4-amino-4-deoxy-L-arabinose transferase-like glycosyltransferase
VSAILESRPRSARSSAEAPSAPVGTGSAVPRDRTVIAVLGLIFAAMAALSWRRWGVPELDAGAEMTTADLVKHGAVVYQDVRYYYGPLGLYSLALAFKLAGTSFTTLYAFGLLQAAAILGAFYALSRQWLSSVAAGLSTAILLAIGFSGTAFNFVLPHTNSATFAVLLLLLMLLALARGRITLAGVAAGLIALTRPEFLAVAIGALAAFVIAQWRIEGRSQALSGAWRLALPAIAIPALVLGLFAARVGAHVLITENLWPVTFIKVGAKTESTWMPFTASSMIALLIRAGIYIGLLAGLVASVERLRERRGASRVFGLWPLAVAILAIALLDGALRATGLLAGERHAIEGEARHLMLGMSWLPALGLATAAYAALRLLRRDRSPLGRSWPADLALIVAAAGLGLRAYNEFTTYGSYAAYYAAPLVLLLGILHVRLAERRPRAATPVIAVLGLIAIGMAAYAVGGLYRHNNTPVHTPRGTFLTTAASAPALQSAVERIDALSRPGDRILAAPLDGGLYFMSDRRPALRELSVLPGLIKSPAEEARALSRLRADHVTLAVIGARDFSDWGTPTFGVDYDKQLGAYLRTSPTAPIVVGSLRSPVAGTSPSQGFTILRLPG